MLDASAAFAGRHERPRELAWAVPFDPEVRPTLETGSFPHTRGDFWDIVFYKGYIIAADIKGGLYSLKAETGPDAGSGSAPSACADQTSPASHWKARISRRSLRLRGTATDAGCGARVARVLVAAARKSGSRCRFLSRRGRLGRPRRCSKPAYVTARAAHGGGGRGGGGRGGGGGGVGGRGGEGEGRGGGGRGGGGGGESVAVHARSRACRAPRR